MQAPTPAQPQAYLTPQEIARRLGVSLRTVYAWLSAGKLPKVKLSRRAVRVRPEDFERFVAERTA